jgi:hypothetical protein
LFCAVVESIVHQQLGLGSASVNIETLRKACCGKKKKKIAPPRIVRLSLDFLFGLG